MLDKKYISAIYAGLNAKGLQGQKEELVSSYTDERTTSTREMKKSEAIKLIAYLNIGSESKKDNRAKMFKKIYALAHEMNITKSIKGKTKVDTKRLDALTKHLSPQNKGLQKHSYDELKTLVTLFKKYYKNRLNKGGFYEDTSV